jgi:hypothetical protein
MYGLRGHRVGQPMRWKIGIEGFTVGSYGKLGVDTSGN